MSLLLRHFNPRRLNLRIQLISKYTEDFGTELHGAGLLLLTNGESTKDVGLSYLVARENDRHVQISL